MNPVTNLKWRAEPKWRLTTKNTILCQPHAEVVFDRLGKANWERIPNSDLILYREGTGHELPCDWCQQILEAKDRGWK